MYFNKNKSSILDCTLRDGSYVNKFGFTKIHAKKILSILESCNIKNIEIGHGMGMGASRIKKFKARESDIQYMKIARETLKVSKWGAFCIPGIANLDDLILAKDYGMNFIRIGANVDRYKEMIPFIKFAKKENFYVCANLMKSYLMAPKDFGKISKELQLYGTDLIYIVDSAGSMFPNEIEEYYYQIKNNCKNLKIGFHGHDNLGLGVANALKAFELKFDIIDASLQGLGRSSGNTILEVFLCALRKRKVQLNIDYIKLMNFSEENIIPILKRKGFSSIDVVSGMASFHSSYMPVIEKVAKKVKIDPRILIIELCKFNKYSAPEKCVKKLALRLSKKKNIKHIRGGWKRIYQNYYGDEQNVQKI
jgi:4-hydroxy 2-oxovalerate aldolase